MKIVYFIVIQGELRHALCRALWRVVSSGNPSEKKRINRVKRSFKHIYYLFIYFLFYFGKITESQAHNYTDNI